MFSRLAVSDASKQNESFQLLSERVALVAPILRAHLYLES